MSWASPFPLKIAISHAWIWTSIQYMVPCAYLSPQPKQHLDWFSVFAQLTAQSPYSLQWAVPSPPPQNCPFAWWTAHLPALMHSHWIFCANGHILKSDTDTRELKEQGQEKDPQDELKTRKTAEQQKTSAEN